jgi:hypothetical protein
MNKIATTSGPTTISPERESASPAMPTGLIHVGTQFEVVVGRPSPGGLKMETGKIQGVIEEFTEEAWMQTFVMVQKKVHEMANGTGNHKS